LLKEIEMKNIFNAGLFSRKKEGEGQQEESRHQTLRIPAGKLRLMPAWGYVVSASALGLSAGRLPASLQTEDFIGNGCAFRLFQRNSEGAGIYLQELGSTVLTILNE
jgi:hypothetical protein